MTKDQILAFAKERGMRPALIVTALPMEMQAVRAHLDHLGSVPGRSGTIYECGQFSAKGNEWLVVVAESGAGLHPAHSVVTSAHIDFDQFEVVIFAGIAGSRKEEAPIGSVVASSYLYMPYSGKHDAEHGFTARPHSLPVDQRLIGSARKVQRDGEWPTRICAPLRETLLDDADYPKPFPPTSFVAPIVSIEAVSANPDSELESHITMHYGDAYAVEMEGYGAAYAGYTERTPLMVVRGISDMRDGKTPQNDAIHQPVAAAHAAAFAMELLDVWGRFQPQLNIHGGRGEIAHGGENAGAPRMFPSPSFSGESNARSVFVLNFDAALADFSEEKLNQILEVLKTQTSDDTLRIIGTEDGSVRLLIEGRADCFEKIDTPEVYETLLREFSAKLTGVLREDEYRKAQSIDTLLQRASRDLLEWPRTLPGGTHLRRPEFDQILSIIDENESSTTALLGPPGSGKSALLASVGQKLAERKAVFIAIKADLLDPSVQSEDELREFLSLSDRLSNLLIQSSYLQPVILLIDQLDALAGYVDLKTGRLSVLLNLVRKLGGFRNIHIILSARTFEYEHDTRLKAVRADSLMLTLPPLSEVLQVLDDSGIQAAGWPIDAQELIRVPQVLATFLRLSERAEQPPFRTYQSMLDQLWKDRILVQPNGTRLAQLAGIIAEKMADRETLWLAVAKFEDRADDLNALVSQGILTDYRNTGSRVGFSHQTVFEHALARAFARGEGNLSAYILDRQASLFVRPKLWAALTYLREVEPSTYESEFQAMWNRRDLRPHLRYMLIEFLGQQASPSTIETRLLEGALKSKDRRVALQAIVGSVGWFDLMKMTHISSAMSDEHEANVASTILDRAWTFDPESVVELVTRNWRPHQSFDGYTWQLLQGCPDWSDEATEIAKEIVDRTDIAPVFFDHTISTVGVEQPEVALKLVSSQLARQLRKAIAEAEEHAALTPPETQDERLIWYMNHSPRKPISDVFEQGHGWDTLGSLAEANGELFLSYVWPHFQSALADLKRFSDETTLLGYPLPYLLDFRFAGESSLNLPEYPLLGAIASAIEVFAGGDDDRSFLEWLNAHEHEDASPAQRLFAHALASHPQRYAERALKFLLDNDNRLYLGNSQDMWATTKRLVRAASPLWMDDALKRFAKHIMDYEPSMPTGIPPERRRVFVRTIGRTRLNILTSLPEERVSIEVRRFIDEQRRRFPEESTTGKIYGPTAIGSPMNAKNMAQASDAEVLNAFQKVPDATGWDHPTRWMVGGNIQLSREFSEFAKTDPERAIQLIDQFEPSFGTRGAGYALDAMAETADPSAIANLIESLDRRGFTGSEFRDGAARAVVRLVRRGVRVEDSTLSTLEGWLVEPLPEDSIVDGDEEEAIDEAEFTDDSEEKQEKDAVAPILWGHGGLAMLPHGRFPILEAITQVLLERSEHERLLSLYERHLKVDEDPDVWQAMLRYLRYLRPAVSTNVGTFVLELFRHYPTLASTQDAAVMLAFLQWQAPDVVRKVISGWGAADGVVQQTYGELVALIAIVQPDLDWPQSMLAEIVDADDMVRARVGAAFSAAYLWSEPKNRQAASRLLQHIIIEADADAWSAVFSLFMLEDEITPEPEWVSFLETMSNHLDEASNLNSSYIVDRLQTLLPHKALLVAEIAAKLITGWKEELSDLRTATASIARDLVDLAITLHRLGPETREAGISLFEDLLAISAYTAKDTLDEIDNRFRQTPRPVRRRLPRRGRHAKPRSIVAS